MFRRNKQSKPPDKTKNQRDQSVKDVPEDQPRKQDHQPSGDQPEISENDASRITALSSSIDFVKDQVSSIATNLERAQIADYLRLLNSPGRLIYVNILSGVARGVGLAIGFTIFAGTIVYFLQLLGALNLPIIGDYIAEIVKIVEGELDGGRPY